jgi:hypothetical protein
VIAIAVLLLMQAATPPQAQGSPVVMEMHPPTNQPRSKAESRITGPYTLIPVKPGVNRISGFAPDKGDAIIVSSWSDNGNAWGHRRYEVIIPSAEGEWNIVAFSTSKTIDGIIEVPHTGEDALSAVRFMWGNENGRRVALAAEADREPKEGVPEPAATTIKIYSMRLNDEVGTSRVHFTLVKAWTAKRLYCNAEMALHDEFGLPLSADYAGPRKTGGCE